MFIITITNTIITRGRPSRPTLQTQKETTGILRRPPVIDTCVCLEGDGANLLLTLLINYVVDIDYRTCVILELIPQLR